IDALQFFALFIQGLRIAVPALLLCIIPTTAVTSILQAMSAWLSDGMAIGGGMIAAVGYAMVINMMSTKEVWPFFIIGFCLAAISQLTLIALGAIGISLA
ncbi:PTS sugar transporter subunit IIC, partial [Streptobacillus moniliformis]|uniref:PTS sugar transporter subunit IIC n=1 Tax=Streptobacillus moniliformis TaxID=34105 RepID=UPI000B246955